MQILAYILRFGLAEFPLTCPFSLDCKLRLAAHARCAVTGVSADHSRIIDGVTSAERRMLSRGPAGIEGARTFPAPSVCLKL